MVDTKDSELLELYKLYVDTATKVTETRLKANAFFTSLNAVIIGSSGFITPALLLFFGIGVNILWEGIIKSQKLLNAAKFKVIFEIEEKLVYPLFRKEWEAYKADRRTDTTDVEKWLPRSIILLYVLMILYTKWEKIVAIWKVACA